MLLTLAYKHFVEHCSPGLLKPLTLVQGFVPSQVSIYNYFAVTRLQDRGRAGVVIQYCNIAPGGLRSINGVQSRVKSMEILHDYTGHVTILRL